MAFGNPKPTPSSEIKSLKDHQEVYNMVSDDSLFGQYYKKALEMLKANGVPETRFPSRVHFMSKIISFIDMDEFQKWIDLYSELESLKLPFDIKTEEEEPEVDA